MPRLAPTDSIGSRSPSPNEFADDIPASIPPTQDAADGAAEEQLEHELLESAHTPASKKGKGSRKQVAEKPAELEEANGSEEGEEDVYDVESVVDHIWKGKKCLYRVRWKGYSEEDDTFEPEEHLLPESAAILARYHEKIGGTPQAPKKVQKSASKGSLRAEKHELANDVASPNNKRQKRKHNGELTPGTKEWDTQPTGTWLPSDKSSWEDLVYEVETVERDDSGNLQAFIRFKNGNRTKVARNLYTSRCPRALLKFYESHLNFSGPTVQEDNEDSSDLPIRS